MYEFSSGISSALWQILKRPRLVHYSSYLFFVSSWLAGLVAQKLGVTKKLFLRLIPSTTLLPLRSIQKSLSGDCLLPKLGRLHSSLTPGISASITAENYVQPLLITHHPSTQQAHLLAIPHVLNREAPFHSPFSTFVPRTTRI